MYKGILVKDKILQAEGLVEDGERLIEELEKKGFSISAAFWRFLDEEGVYRLVIVSPIVGREGPLRTYMHVIEAIDALGKTVHFGLSDVSVMSPSWSQFQELRRAIESAGGKSSDRGTTLGDYYLYRWNPDVST